MSCTRLVSRLSFPVIIAALAMLASCGSSSPTGTAPPTGGFSNSNLNGTYVFSATGLDINNYSIAYAGTFSANGSGSITAGTVDINSPDPTVGPLLDLAVTGGSYSIGADGRPKSQSGLITLQTSAGPITLDFVLSSSEHGLVTEFDGNGSASGTLDLQANVTQGNIDGQSYAFNFVGSAGEGTVLCNLTASTSVPIPFATVGAFTLDSNGNMSTGVQDFNNNCSSTGETDLAITSGSISLASVPGTAVINSSNGITYNFDVFPVNTTHLKFIEVDSVPVVAGDAFTQVSAVPTGNNVFTLAGFDETLGVPFAAAGLMVTDGNGTILATSVEDINDGGTASEVTSGIGGSYTAASGGRSVLTFTSGFINGGGGVTGCTSCQFAAYPSSGGLQLLEIDNGGLTGGAAYAQSTSSTSLASGQGYGLNLSGASSGGTEEDDIAEFTNTSNALTGIIDVNDQGTSTLFDNSYSATYAADSTVTGRGTVTPTKNAYYMTTYVIDASNAAVVSTDANLVAVGTLSTQNATEASSAASTRLTLLKPRGAITKTAPKKKTK